MSTTSTAVRTCRRAEQERPPADPDSPRCGCGCGYADNPTTRPCAKCGHHPRKTLVRELCPLCYRTALKRGKLADYPRRTRSRDDVLDDWAILRAEGHTLGQAADRLRMTRAALDAALTRARRDGDPRALRPLVYANRRSTLGARS